MFELKPDFEQVLARYEAWWRCAIVDRPLVSMRFAKPPAERVAAPERRYASERERWMDTDGVVRRAEAALRNHVHFADALPVAYPNLGPEVFSAFYGCPLEFGEITSWSVPILKDWSPGSLAGLRIDPSNVYYRKILEITDALLAAARGVFIVGYTDLHPGGDAVAAFRDPQELCLDVLEHPAQVKALTDRVTDDFLQLYDAYHARLSAAGMPSTTWCHATCRGKFHVPSNDFSCMISSELFEDLFVPGIVRECRHMDRCIYHLDGPQALRYLDRLLDIPEIHAIQWVPGAGRDHWAKWIDVYRHIQARGKALQIASVPAAELPRLFEVLRPEGVWISNVGGITNKEEADAALKAIARWGA